MIRHFRRPGVFDFLFGAWVVLVQCRFMESTRTNCAVYHPECRSGQINTFLPCFSRVPGTECEYVTGYNYTGSIPSVTDLNFPAAPVNLTAFTYYTPYYRYESGCKYSALNISWEIRFDASVYHLKGFLLHVVSSSNSNINIVRIFNVSFNYDELKKPVRFYYPCIFTNSNSTYTVKVSSLPLAPEEYDNSIERTEFIPSTTKIDANHTCYWIAAASVYCNQRSLMVTFSPAPVDFGFSVYNIFLISDPFVLQQLAINTTDDEPVSFEFKNVTQGHYIVRIQPRQLTPCMCRRGPEESDCCEFCSATDISVTVRPACTNPDRSTAVPTTPEPPMHPVMTERSVESSTESSNVPTTTESQLTGTADGVHTLTQSQFAGVVVAVVAGVTVAVGVLVLLLYRTRLHHRPSVNECPEVMEPQRILIVCCSNNDLHMTAVRKFLRFLEAKCNLCVVVIDNNCLMPAESMQVWLMEEISLAKKIVLFHSVESVAMAWHFTRLAITHSVALKTFMAVLEMFSHSRIDPSKLVNVYFSYTPSHFVVNVNCGQTYQLMSEFDKFLTNIRGSSSFDNSALLACEEGRELQRAIMEAMTDAETRPHNYDWFGCLAPTIDTDSIDTLSLSRMVANADTDSVVNT